MADETVISVEDKLTFKTMEADFYLSQIQSASSQQATQQKLEAIRNFTKTLHEKYEKNQKEWAFDKDKLDFVPMPMSMSTPTE